MRNASGAMRRSAVAKPIIVLAVGLLTLWGAGRIAAEAPRATQPFAVGERLTYDLSWGVITAGTAVLEVADREQFNGRPALKLLHRARSNAMLSAFFPIDDRLESLVDAESLAPYRFVFQRQEGSRRNDIEVLFDQTSHQAMTTKDGHTETHQIPADVQDTLSWLYFIRSLRFSGPVAHATIPIYHDGKINIVEVRYEGTQQITGGLGEFDTIHLQAMMPARGLFSNRGPIHVWLTNDQDHIPVLLRTKVAVGSLVATLTSREGAP